MHTIALLTLLATTPAQGFGAPPSFSARLLAAHEAVAPGGSTELAIEVTIEPEWHIYHRNPVATGFPTTFEFELPPGFSVGEVRYPLPKLSEMSGIAYQGYGGKVVFLAPLSVDAGVKPGDEAAIRVKVNALACLESCIPVDAEAKLTLPVRAEPGPPANAELFAQARKKLPPPLDRAPQLAGARVLLSQDKLRPNDAATLAVEIEIEKGWHIQARNPGVEGLIPSKLTIEPIDGLLFGDQSWPAPKEVEFPVLGKVRQHDGKLVIRTPVTLTDSKMEPGVRKLWMMFEYQACNEEGMCLAPVTAEIGTPIEIAAADAEVRRIDDPAFTAVGPTDGGSPGGANAKAVAAGRAPQSLLIIFLFAFAGGALLNIMPCVLPVISLKIFGFMQQAGDDRGRIFVMGLVYAAGILASFAVLAAVMYSVGIAWGGMMQSPVFVIALSSVVFAFALSLFGVFEVQLPGAATSAMGEAASREGFGGAFLNGVLATALATPCTAPLLAPALGAFVQLPGPIMVSGIMTVGLGLAAPYVLLTAFPAWLRFLPKPGNWMITFKQFMGFVLMGTLVWLLWTLYELVDKEIFFTALSFFCFLGVACWLIGRISLSDGAGRRAAVWTAALAILGVGWFGPAALLAKDPDAIQWRVWSPGIAEKLSQEGYTVYVDYTATWCLTCLANKKTALETKQVRRLIREMNVVPLKADFTRENPAIKADLERYQRNGVPLNIILPAGKPDQAIVLPEVLTKGTVVAQLKRAGKSARSDAPNVPLVEEDANVAGSKQPSKAKIAATP